MKIWGRGLLAIVAGIFCMNAPGRVSTAQSFDIAVMTQNLYIGADTNPILRATSLPELQVAIVNASNSIIANDFVRRAEAIANEITASNRPPLLIGLQESGIVSQGSLSVNYADILITALKARGLNYTYSFPGIGAAVHTGFTLDSATVGIVNPRFTVTDQEVVLMRADLPNFAVTGMSAPTFTNDVTVSSPLIGAFPLRRGYVRVSATLDGVPFTFVSTHLAETHDALEPAEVSEILTVLNGAGDRQIVVGDFNARPGEVCGGSPCGPELMIAAGFTDTGPGLAATCCQAPTLDNAVSLLSNRFDYIFERGFKPHFASATLVGDQPFETARPIWASDHAGILAIIAEPSIVSVTAVLGGNGGGVVTSEPAGIACGSGNSQCSAGFVSGSLVTLSASASAGSVFSGWSGGGCSGTANCVLSPTQPTSVTAVFTATASEVSLTTIRSGAGSGTVSSNPSGINCGPVCTASYQAGTVVALSANADPNSVFSGWTGGGCSGTGSCQVTLNATTTITANFDLAPLKSVSVARLGNGSGTVTGTPGGIACGTACSATLPAGTQVVLSAQADSGSTFAGWSGAGCAGTKTCSVTLNADVSVNATFVQNASTAIKLFASVLPTSRSVQVGKVATAFATIINSGPGDASVCGISPPAALAASFDYQTTDPATNVVTGTANTPVNIAQNSAQSFVIAITPTTAFSPTDLPFNFACANADPAPQASGLNTLLISSSIDPVPDVVALAASADPGYVDIPGATGTGVFAVATVNLGAAAAITVNADTGGVSLPLTILVCQTDPLSGACLGPPTAQVGTTIGANATPTFGFFVTGRAPIADLPGTNRVFARFKDADGAVRGSTSVAVRTR